MASTWIKYVFVLHAMAYLWIIAYAYKPQDLLTDANKPKDLLKDNVAIPISKDPSLPTAIPCPNPQDIQPCACYAISNTTMDINCSNVTSEDQLRVIFNRRFPFINFRALTIQGNIYLNALRGGDLGKCTFQNIDIRDSALIEIDDSVLQDSANTLATLVLINNNLVSIPDISQFTHLWSLDFSYNALIEFPQLYSTTLTRLVLQGYTWDMVPVDGFKHLPALDTIRITFCSIVKLQPETFTNNNFGYINLESNSIDYIPTDAFHMIGTNNTLRLNNNRITSIPPGAFSGITGTLQLSYNFLKDLPEDIWRPLLENNVMLYIAGNPFNCGCEIAWLILNQTLLGRIHDQATCYDGQAFVDLNPIWYETMCY
ncbi:oplophorus-luciferin 2-monooxygenase non-catalytic subunit-like [Macrobrachium nipponense]|uniref:oplophorus-luciferin 2-monooxygenase non-catalytic subunit-like n=1 Tax=Macrobrachium nipponense TaxID=159736 RepID=UPI0030C869F0